MKKKHNKKILICLLKILSIKSSQIKLTTEFKKFKVWDSLNQFRFLIEIEKITKKKIDHDLFYKAKNLRSIFNLINHK